MANGAKTLPINHSDSHYMSYLDSYRNTTNEGIYIFQVDKSDPRDFKAIVLDETKKEIVILIYLT